MTQLCEVCEETRATEDWEECPEGHETPRVVWGEEVLKGRARTENSSVVWDAGRVNMW